jgi:hypothetical protein
MAKKRSFWFIRLFVVVVALGLMACGGGEATGVPAVAGQSEDSGTTVQTNGSANGELAPTETPSTAAGQYPETLVIHPDATDIEAKPASGMYVYLVPLTAEETSEYMLAEMKTLGWEELGKPSTIGHLATINMQMGRSRVAISMQYNERSQTTRVQMSLMK